MQQAHPSKLNAASPVQQAECSKPSAAGTHGAWAKPSQAQEESSGPHRGSWLPAARAAQSWRHAARECSTLEEKAQALLGALN
jgi:hypothetical protein